jgi:hypothetical protein
MPARRAYRGFCRERHRTARARRGYHDRRALTPDASAPSKAPDQILLDVAGVGLPRPHPASRPFYELPEVENPASLWIHTHVREDALALSAS